MGLICNFLLDVTGSVKIRHSGSMCSAGVSQCCNVSCVAAPEEARGDGNIWQCHGNADAAGLCGGMTDCDLGEARVQVKAIWLVAFIGERSDPPPGCLICEEKLRKPAALPRKRIQKDVPLK